MGLSPEAPLAAGLQGAPDIHIAALDLVDGFYQLEMPGLLEYSRVEYAFTAEEWGVSTAASGEQRSRSVATPSSSSP